MISFETIGFIGTTITVIAYIPQIWRLWRTKDAKGVSSLAWFIWLVSTAMILSYAISVKDRVFITYESFAFVFILFVFILAVKYRRTGVDN